MPNLNLTGKVLGKVRIDMFLARGGMADVFIGTHTTLHRAVAVKFLKGDLQDDAGLRERFEREARVIAILRHPNIVQIYDFDTYDNQPYLVMEYVPGTSLSAYLKDLHKNDLRLDIAQVNRLLVKLADALKFAHDNDVIHRDVKPGNILLTSRSYPVSAGKPLPTDVEPILTDFGLVRFVQSKTQTSTGVITGTPAYMSPEQARGTRVDTRTDVYSLGITVYEMLAGRIPFDSDSTMSLLHMQIYDPPPPIEGLAPELQDVINRALEKDPEQRFKTPIEFAEAFQAAIAGTAEATTLIFPPSAFSNPSVVNSKSKTSPTPPPRNAAKDKVRRPTPILIGMISLLVLGSMFVASRFLNPASLEPEPSLTHEHTEVAEASSSASPVPGASEAEPVGLVRFQDGTAKADQITLSTTNMPPPPEGSQYQAWLITDDGEQRLSIGFINFDGENRGAVTFVDNQGRNLIGLYNGLEITTEPDPDNSPNPSNEVAYSVTLPQGGFTHVRHLLYSYDDTPNEIALIYGLDANAKLINESADAMLASFASGDQADVRLQAEKILNAIVGSQSEDYKDWNGNGTIDDSGDGFGLLLNGNNDGYIQAVFSHANFAVTAPDATQNMIVHGEHVKIAATNVGEWTPQLRDQLIALLDSPSDSEIEGMVRQAVALANQIRNGVDINGNENIEAIPGEGGTKTAYDHAYYMADMLVLP